MSLLDVVSSDERKSAKKATQPKKTSPMLATLTDDRFSSEDWIYERKLDGERCLAFKRRKRVELYSRNKKSLNATYPELVDAFEAAHAAGFIVDGEVVAFEGNVTSFARLQNRMKIKNEKEARESGTKVYFYIFDVLYADGHDVTRLPLSARKKILKELLDYDDPLRRTAFRRTHGETYHKEACQKGWEGVIAKKYDSAYVHSRSSNWLKFKCVNEQELVIGGYTDPQGSRIGFGALLVGYYMGDTLKYAGKVGTGYDDETLRDLHDKMSSIERESSPFDDDVSEKNVHWVTPKLVGQFGFTEWTEDNRLRHPRYLGLRRDKDPRKVKKETPEG